MGKKKRDKKAEANFERGLYSKFYGPGKDAHDMLDRYGVEGGRIGKADQQIYDRTKTRSADDVKKDLQEAMMNDYDTRRSLEAAAMAGDKDAKRYAKNGIDAKAKDFLGSYQVMKNLKKEYVGGGGMRGADNEAGLTYALVKNDRQKQTEGYRDEFASKSALADLEGKLNSKKQEEDAKFTPEKSEQYLKDEATVEYFDENFATGGIYGDESERGPAMSSVYKEYGAPLLEPMMNKREADEKNQANEFLDAYKKDLFQGGAALMPEI